MINESIQYLVESLDKAATRKRALEAEDTMLLLGAKFVDEINSTDSIQGLSKTLLKANKMAYSMGLPQMASQINNLGQLKQKELLQGKSDMLNQQMADVTRDFVGSQKVIVDGKSVPLKNTEDFKKGEALDASVQVEYYKKLLEDRKTEVISQLDISDPGNPMLKQYRIDPKTGNQITELQLSRGTTGFYDDLLTPGVIENMPEPYQISQFKNDMALKENQRKESLQTWITQQDIMDNRNASKGKLTDVIIIDDQGKTVQRPAIVFPATNKNPYGRVVDPKTHEDITDKLASTKTYKSTQDRLKTTDKREARTEAFLAGKELFEEISRRGLISGDVIENVAEATGLDDKMLQQSVSGYAYGMMPNFNPVKFISDMEASGDLQKILQQDDVLKGMYDDFKAIAEHAKKLQEQGRKEQQQLLENESVDSKLKKNQFNPLGD